LATVLSVKLKQKIVGLVWKTFFIEMVLFINYELPNGDITREIPFKALK